MNDIVQFVENHGYAILSAIVFARQIGLPVPEFPFLLAAGSLAAAGKLGFVAVIFLAVGASLLADWLWYEAGRRGGDKALHFLYRFTRDPESHDRRAKKFFLRHGLSLLLVAKFVPGLDAIAPPMTGTSGTGRIRFLAFDAAGAILYACVYVGLGYVFSHDLSRAFAYVSQARSFSVIVALIGVCMYVVYKLVRQHRRLREPGTLRIAPADPFECGDSGEMPCRIVGGHGDGD